MIIIVNLTIIIGLPVRVVDRQPPVQDMSWMRPQRPADWQNLHEAHCTICNDWTQWYESPGKARMGLSGHQSWCRRRK